MKGRPVRYHVSRAGTRDLVEQLGLLPRDPRATEGELSYAEHGGWPAGVYMWRSLEEAVATMIEGEVWAIDTDGLELLPDPFFDGEEVMPSCYTPQPVGPERLTHMFTIRDGKACAASRSSAV